jgi:hypothetical protein
MVLVTKLFATAIKYILARMVPRYQTQMIVMKQPICVLQMKLCVLTVLVLQELALLHISVLEVL